jgi:2-polyprenyl-6-methoxyphenol hydroxylase-like FAD-dependent oxidoreductase
MHSLRGHRVGRFDLAAWATQETGYGMMRIKRIDLVNVLLKTAEEKGVSVRFDKKITSIAESGEAVTATFSDGTTDTADLLLGCDGIHSTVRRLYVDPEMAPEYSGISAIGSIVPTSSLPPTTPRLTDTSATFTAEGMFGVIPCTASGDEIFWFFSREVAIPESGETRDGWEVHRKKEVEGFQTMLLDILGDASGEWGYMLKELVRKTTAVKFYPVYRLPKGGRWSKGRVLLLGDAAHAMQPHASQGVSMALEDVFLISRLLEAVAVRPLPETLEKFSEIRRPRVDWFHSAAAANGEVRKRTGPWGLWAKETGIWLALLVFTGLGLDKWGLGQKSLAYDIEDEQI